MPLELSCESNREAMNQVKDSRRDNDELNDDREVDEDLQSIEEHDGGTTKGGMQLIMK